MSLDMWLAWLAACWLISLTPGAGAIASMSSGLKHGFWPGYWNVVGLQLALLLQILVVALGVGAVLVASETAFSLIKWAGVLYLLYLAWKQWQAVPSDLQPAAADAAPVSIARLIGNGFVVNSSNPKAIVFMLAILPQFLDPTQPLVPQYSLMAFTMVATDMIVMAGYTGLAARVLKYLRTPRQQRYLNRSFAAMFAGMASMLSLVNRTH
ncbi:LysE family transporter [Parathalassolituus penaei]|uniref:LysE family transporter n=1 Tax=Parathalassolituus penaei TaxID=2997323 RepID=A0A9X3EDW7_9GAMM|nr:LysE family transporter [Parathalassolituus penaei]MCY0965415.1 LysE family transporter [Parathalassolituus penaei]